MRSENEVFCEVFIGDLREQTYKIEVLRWATLSEEKLIFSSTAGKLTGLLRTPAPSGAFPLLLICHAYGDAKETYDEMVASLLTRGIGSFVFDFRGHGESDGPRFFLHVPDWVEDIRAALDFLVQQKKISPEKIFGYGFSSGGSALLKAARDEKRLAALVTVDATTRDSLPVTAKAVIQGLCELGRIKKWLTGTEVRIPLSIFAKAVPFLSDPNLNREAQAELKRRGHYWPLPGGEEAFLIDIQTDLPCIKQPTLVIWGEDDKLDPVESAELLFKALPGEKKLVVIPGNGHAGHRDRHRQKVFDLTADWVLTHAGFPS